MSSLNNLYNTLERQAQFASIRDGFPSEEFRKMALEELRQVKLGRRPHGNYSFAQYSDVEKIRMEYLQTAGDIGAQLACQYLNDKILLPPDHFLRPIINTGLQEIGRDIMRSYAAEVYPQLRRKRLLGEKDQDFPVKKKTKREAPTYGFVVKTDRNIYDLSKIQEMTDPPGSHIHYDDICERHIETFIFQSIEEADSAHWNWQKFIDRKNPTPPVKYAVRIETDLDNDVNVSTVIHADPFEQSRTEFAANGSSIEWKVCSSLSDAENIRQERLKARHEQTADETSAIPLPSPGESMKAKEPEKERSIKESPEIAQKDKRKHMPISK